MRKLFLSSFAGAWAQPLIRRAGAALEGARTDLQNAAHDCCGHRVDALNATRTALNQLKQAIQCDKK